MHKQGLFLQTTVATVLLLAHRPGCVGNPPPLINVPSDIFVEESEPIGQVVARSRVHTTPGTQITRHLSPSNSGKNGAPYFEVDQSGKILIAKSLQGLAGESLYFNLVVNGGSIPTSKTIHVHVTQKGMIPTGPGSGIYNHFQKGTLGYAINGAPIIPPSMPFLNGPDPNRALMPILLMEPHTQWKIAAETQVETQIATVEVHDVAGDGFNFGLKPSNLVKINPRTGAVIVVSSLKNKVGDHELDISVTNRYGTVHETVILTILPSALISEPQSTSRPPQKPYYSRPTYKPTNSNDYVSSISPKDPPGNQTTAALTLGAMIATAAAVTFIPLSVICFYFCWKKYNSRKARKLACRSTVSMYCEKDGSTIISDISLDSKHEQEELGIYKRIRSFWKRRLSGNKYEDPEAPKVPSRDIGHVHPPLEEDHWEMPRHHLTILGILGEGCFGQVWKAECKTPNMRDEYVAVKTLKKNAGIQERNDLLQELKVLKNLGKHPNVVSLLACCTEKDPIFVVLEYMTGGKLQSYLRASRGGTHSYNNLHSVSTNLLPKDLTIFALQIAKGMSFLAQNRIIHRDLAARNILVGDHKICKVADFGFARDVANNHIYERKSDGRLPIRWMAPESLYDNIFTVKSDVWSFGILLWEIVTLGSTPYPGLSAQEVMHRVKSGYRLEKPDHCRRELYNIMYYCWAANADDRPSYDDLIESLENLLLSEVEYIQLDRFPEHGYYNFIVNSQSGELL